MKLTCSNDRMREFYKTVLAKIGGEVVLFKFNKNCFGFALIKKDDKYAYLVFPGVGTSIYDELIGDDDFSYYEKSIREDIIWKTGKDLRHELTNPTFYTHTCWWYYEEPKYKNFLINCIWKLS